MYLDFWSTDCDAIIRNPLGFQESFVQHIRCFFKFVLLLAERVLLLTWVFVSYRLVQSVFVTSVEPFHGFPFELACCVPRDEVFEDFCLEQSDDGFGQCVVVAVSDASDRHVDSGFGELSGV